MVGFRTFCLFIVVLTGFLFSQMSSWAETCNRVVAKVNSEVITLYELNLKIEELTDLNPVDLRSQDERKFFEIREKVIDLLINEKIALEKIQELEINVTPEEIDSAIERIKSSNNLTHEDLIATLKEKGLSYESYKEKIKNEIDRIKLINLEVKSKIIVREEQIKAYFDKHKEKYTTKERIHLAAIFLKQTSPSDQSGGRTISQRARQILSRHKNGEDFGQLAKEFSQGPGAQDGGDLGFFEFSQIDPELKETINDMSAGEISHPIVRPSGIQIIKLMEKQETRVKSLDEVRDSIYEIFYREEINKRYLSWIKDLKEKAYIKIIF